MQLELISNQQELNLIKKYLEWPKIINLCQTNLEVHHIPYYLYELSSEFHAFWNLGKTNEDLKIIDHPDENVSKSRLYLLQKLYIILKTGLKIIDVDISKKM